jgi:hypothetical protein
LVSLAIVGGLWGSQLIDLYLGKMDFNGNRFLYVDTRQDRRPVVTLDLNRQDLGAAPSLTNLNVAPASVKSAGPWAKLTVKVTSSGAVNAVGATLLRGDVEDTRGSCSGPALYDDGTNGDAQSGDGIYTSDRIGECATATPGPRLIRVGAETTDAGGKRHATVVDFGPFAIE